MSGHVFRHPVEKGRTPCAVRPLTGRPVDAEGRLILEFVYPPKTKTVRVKAPADLQPDDPVQLEITVAQPTLL